LCLLRDNVEKYSRNRHPKDANIIRRMDFACWVTKATETHSEYVIIIAFTMQEWLGERASLLCFLHTLPLLLSYIPILLQRYG